MEWSVLRGFRVEHEFVVAELGALSETLHALAVNGHTTGGPEVAPVLARAEGVRHAFLAHRLEEEDGFFPEVQKVVSGGLPGADGLDGFLSGEAREDLSAHLMIDGHLGDLVEMLRLLAAAATLDPQTLAQARACATQVHGLLRDHAGKEDSVIFPRMARVLTPERRREVVRRLEELRAEAALPEAKTDRLRVLVADDEWVLRELVGQVLTRAGYRVVLAENGSQAWQALEQGTYSLAVLDWVMPGMDGLAICRALRERAQENHVYVILVTGKASTTDLVAGLEAGADDYLRKPFSSEELRARVRVGERMIRMQQQADRHHQALVATALMDEVTGLPNRRAILTRLEEAHQRQARDGRPLSLLLADLDDFKAVNDTYGHGAGDRALREFSHRVCAAVRPYDVTGRFGGDEFLVVLPDTDEAQAAHVGERVRAAVSDTAFDLGAAGLQRVTASWGVVEVEAAVTLEETLARADQALYESKARGGNCVCAPPTPSSPPDESA